jgi:hypothetical protein
MIISGQALNPTFIPGVLALTFLGGAINTVFTSYSSCKTQHCTLALGCNFCKQVAQWQDAESKLFSGFSSGAFPQVPERLHPFS